MASFPTGCPLISTPIQFMTKVVKPKPTTLYSLSDRFCSASSTTPSISSNKYFFRVFLPTTTVSSVSSKILPVLGSTVRIFRTPTHFFNNSTSPFVSLMMYPKHRMLLLPTSKANRTLFLLVTGDTDDDDDILFSTLISDDDVCLCLLWKVSE